MVGATTFVPLPADTFVLSAAASSPALAIGVIGGLINATVALVERAWVVNLIDSPRFARFRDFFGTNRFVAWTERNMFLALIVGGASFLPFEPFRLVAALTSYPTIKYFLATLIGRGCRYFVLALAGSTLLEIGFLQQAIWISLALFLFGLWRSGLKLFRGSQTKTPEIESPEAEDPEAQAPGIGAPDE